MRRENIPKAMMSIDFSGIGTDLVEIERIKKSIERQGEHLLRRLFTEKEIAYCQKFRESHERFAARFAAKEAIAKALGTGLGKDLQWLDLEILNDSSGKPYVDLSKSAKKRFSNPKILLSISHSKTHAIAVAFATH